MQNLKIDKIIDLSVIFKQLENKYYCIIKLPESYHNYKIGSDLDIFCYNIHDIANIILCYLQKFITSELKIKIINNKIQILLDVIYNGKLYFRFNLYGALPHYMNIKIKEAFFSSVIENSKKVNIKNVKIKVPSDIDDVILRYIEYHEWYAEIPDKINHIKYIEAKIESKKIDLNNILDKLHYYTSIPEIKENSLCSSHSSISHIQNLYGLLKKILKYLQTYGLIKTLHLVKWKLFFKKNK